MATAARVTYPDALHRYLLDAPYACIGVVDSSSLFYGLSSVESRSLMNVIFRTKSDAVDAEFIKQAEKHGIISIKGHRATGGMRASLYNAMPTEGVQHLVEFMREFENSGDYHGK